MLIATAASALAALPASRLGIAGTVAGAALAPLLVALVRVAGGIRPQRLAHLSGTGIAVALGTAAVAFAAGMGLLSMAESIVGKPVSAVGRSSPHSSGTTIGAVAGSSGERPQVPEVPPDEGGGRTAPEPPPSGTTPAPPPGGEPPPT